MSPTNVQLILHKTVCLSQARQNATCEHFLALIATDIYVQYTLDTRFLSKTELLMINQMQDVSTRRSLSIKRPAFDLSLTVVSCSILVSVYYKHNLWASTASCIHLPQPALLPPPTHTPELHPSPIPCTVGCEWPSTSKSRIRLSLAAGGRRGCLTWWGCHWERRQAPLGQYEWLGGETTTHNAMYTDFKLCMGS